MRRCTVIVAIAALLNVGTASAETKAKSGLRLEQAQGAGIIYKIGMVDSTPTIVIDEQVFAGLPFDAKQNIIDTLNCALFDDGSKLCEVVIVCNTTHKQLARWTLFKGLVVD